MTTVTVNFSQAALTTLEAHRAARPTPTQARDIEKIKKAGKNLNPNPTKKARG